MAVICPRCRRESKDGTLFCPGCGAPLSLRTEPAPAALDTTLSLDRRLPDEELPDRPPSRAPAMQPQLAGLAAGAAVRSRTPPPPAPVVPAVPLAPAVRAAPVIPAVRATPVIPAVRPPPAQGRPAPGAVIPADRAPPVLSGPPPSRFGGSGPDRSPPSLFTPPLREPTRRPAAAALPMAPEPEPEGEPVPDDGTVEVDVGPVEVHLRRASGTRRVAAWVIDGVPFLALFALALRAALGGLSPVPLDLAASLDLAAAEARGITLPLLAGTAILFAVYHTLAHALAGATLGKRLLGLRVVGPGGTLPGLGRSAWRAVAAALSLGLLGLGVLLALFTRSGRALHDLLARTWVVEAP